MDIALTKTHVALLLRAIFASARRTPRLDAGHRGEGHGELRGEVVVLQREVREAQLQLEAEAPRATSGEIRSLRSRCDRCGQRRLLGGCEILPDSGAARIIRIEK